MVDKAELTIGRRLLELVFAGEKLLKKFNENNAIDFQDRPECVAWMLSVVNLLEVAMPSGNRYRVEAQRLLPPADVTIWPGNLANVLGILKSANAEWTNGLINTLEFHFVGLAFEDFLRHATVYNDSDKKLEAAVLASAVLEDTMKKLCAKHNIATEDKTLDSLISALKANQVVGKVKAERLRSYAALRNRAFHAEWDAFDKRDLRQMIEGLEELLEAHLK